MLSRVIVMSTNLEYRESERQGKGESRRQAGEAQQEKERQRARARDTKQRRRISLEEQHENFIPAVRKWEMLAASKVENEQQWKKVNRNQQNLFCAERYFLHKTCNQEVSPLLIFCRSRRRRRLALHDFIFFVWVNYNYINEGFAFSPR